MYSYSCVFQDTTEVAMPNLLFYERSGVSVISRFLEEDKYF